MLFRSLTTGRATRGIVLVVGVGGAAPEIVLRLEAQERNGDVGLDVGDGAGISQDSGSWTLGRTLDANIAAVANSTVVAIHIDSIFQADRDASKRSLHVDRSVLDPFLRRRDHDLGDAVCLFLGLDRNLAVCMQELRGSTGVLVNLADELLDGLVNDFPVEDTEGTMVGLQGTDAANTLILFEPAEFAK